MDKVQISSFMIEHPQRPVFGQKFHVSNEILKLVWFIPESRGKKKVLGHTSFALNGRSLSIADIFFAFAVYLNNRFSVARDNNISLGILEQITNRRLETITSQQVIQSHDVTCEKSRARIRSRSLFISHTSSDERVCAKNRRQ